MSVKMSARSIIAAAALATTAALVPATASAQQGGVWSCTANSVVATAQGAVNISRQFRMQLGTNGQVYGEGYEVNMHGSNPMRFQGQYWVEGATFNIRAQKSGGFGDGQFFFISQLRGPNVMTRQQAYANGGGIETACQLG